MIPARPSAGRRHQDGFCLFLCYLMVFTSLGGPWALARALYWRAVLVLVLWEAVATETLLFCEVTPFLCLSNC